MMMTSFVQTFLLNIYKHYTKYQKLFYMMQNATYIWKDSYTHNKEKAMAPHSNTLAWRIPGTGETGGLPSMGLHSVGHNWSDLAAAAP